jgi:hypothetical protein
MSNSQFEAMNERLSPRILTAALFEILDEGELQGLREQIPDNIPVLDEYERRGLRPLVLNHNSPQRAVLQLGSARRLLTPVITANTPSIFSTENLSELALPEPSIPYGSTNENSAQAGSNSDLQGEDSSKDSSDSIGFDYTDIPAPRSRRFIPSPSSISEDGTAVEHLEDSDFADDETAVDNLEDSDSLGDVESLGYREVDDDDDDYNSYWIPSRRQSFREYYDQPPQNLLVGRAVLPEYISPYGVSITVQEILEEQLSESEAEVGEDEVNTPPAPPPAEIYAEEGLPSMHFNIGSQFREHIEDGAENILGYVNSEGQWQLVDLAVGEVEFLPDGYDIDGAGAQRPTGSERVRLRAWNGLLRMGSRNPSPVASENNSQFSSIRRGLRTVMDKAKRWLRK